MPRRLILMRHAKAAAQSPSGRDHDRPLAPRGRADADFIARVLHELGWSPTRVVSSDATRTRQTWRGMEGHFSPSLEVSFHPELYLAGLPAIQQEALRWDPAQTGPLLLLGHNPGWEAAASTLAGRPLGMTTANAVLLESDGPTWAEALRLPWRLVRHLVPKQLRLRGIP